MKFKRLLLVVIVLAFVCVVSFLFLIRPGYVVPILMYHHIDGAGKTSSLSTSGENFERQMRFLSRHSYNVISFAEFLQAKSKKQDLPHNTVLITFDDGYADNYTSAFPALKKYGLAATVFVIVDEIGKEGYLNYSQMEEMLSSGLITIGSHTLKHAYLPRLNKAELQQEIGLSKKILQAKLKKEIDFFCYPLGHFGPQIQEIVKRCGYKAACTTNRGRRQTCFNDDIFALKRIKVRDSSPNLLVFWIKLSGYYNLFRTVRPPY